MAMDDLVGQRDCRPLVYIASPYAKGDQIRNVRASLDVFNRLLEDGVVIPVAPLLACLAHLVHPRSVEEWMAYDLALLARCDAVLARDARHGQYVQVRAPGGTRRSRSRRPTVSPSFGASTGCTSVSAARVATVCTGVNRGTTTRATARTWTGRCTAIPGGAGGGRDGVSNERDGQGLMERRTR